MELRFYLRMIVKGWWIILLALIASIVAAVGVISVSKPSYRVDTRFVISPNPDIVKLDDRIYSLDALNRRSIITTYSEVLNSRRLLESARQLINLNPVELAEYSVSTVVLPDANVLQLFVEGPNPFVAVQLADAVANLAMTQIRELYQVYNITILDPPVVPVAAVRPKPAQDIGLAGVLGLGVGVGLALLRGVLSLSVSSAQRASQVDRDSGAWSRSYFRQQLEAEISRSATTALSIGLLHLPGLQDLSLIAPPAVLQNILARVKAVLQEELRGKDVTARWAESGFVVLFPVTSEASAYRTMQIVQLALSRPMEYAGETEAIALRPQTTVLAREGNETAAQLLERADQAYKKL